MMMGMFFLCQETGQSTVWTKWLCEEHAEKYKEEENFGGAGGLLNVDISSHLSSAKPLGISRTMASSWG